MTYYEEKNNRLVWEEYKASLQEQF
uniref:Uncharacterized protein n=1 Tax=Arundo donax TaxID=35708 RepID=A0A0A9GSP6_ARUDO